MRAVFFVLSSLQSGRIIGLALICPEARYAAIRWTAHRTIDRRYVTDRFWESIEDELMRGFFPGPLPRRSSVAGLLTSNADTVIEYVGDEPVPEGALEAIVPMLDRHLLQLEVPARGPR